MNRHNSPTQRSWWSRKTNSPQSPSANLSGVDFRGSDLSQLDLTGVNLENATLIGVNLSKANLINANLKKITFQGVDLSEAKLDGYLFDKILEGSTYDKNTVWPAGFEPQVAGATLEDKK